MSEYSTQERSGWTGWVVFAGIMMIIAGILWTIVGFVAVFNNDWVVFGREAALFVDISGWGWLHIILGLLMLLAGFLVIQGNLFGRTIAVILAVISIVVNFLWLPVYPIWSIVIIAIDVFVIYAVIVHGRELKDA
jgi:vacuolar-type H+-ATPase subunit I/STV1